MKVETVSIIGCQRVGQSIGLAFKKALPDIKIVGHDRDQAAMKAAKEIGAIDDGRLNLVSAASAGDIVFLTEPLSEIEKTFAAIGRDVKEHAVIIDTAPLKRPVQKWADTYIEKGHYVCVSLVTSPNLMLGIEPTGDLYRESVMAMMPSSKVDEDAVETAETIGRVLGAKAFFVNIDEFDIYAQALNTLPGILSATYFRALTETTGWEDMRRLADVPFAYQTRNLIGEEELGTAIVQDKVAMAHWIDTMINQLVEMKTLIDRGDKELIGAWMQELNIRREEWIHERNQNNWQEEIANVERRGLGQQLFGGLAGNFGRD